MIQIDEKTYERLLASELQATALENKNKALAARNAALEDKTVVLEAEVNWYREQFGLAQKRLYGPSSERTPVGQEELLFNEAEACASDVVPDPQTEQQIRTHTRRKPGAQQEKLEGLPVEEIDYRLPEEEQFCPKCGSPLHDMGCDTRTEIKIIPAQVLLVKHNRHKYACRPCEHNETSTPILTAPAPKPAFPGSLASASAVAYIMSQKYVEGLPLYRLEESFRRMGFELSRQTMSNWVIQGSAWLEQMYRRFKTLMLQQQVLFADETPVQVLREPGRKAQQQSYMWLYRNNDELLPIVLYEYQETREGQHPRTFLCDFKGYLHVDGYAGYDGMTDIILVGCWAHARRNFFEALQVLPPMDRKKLDTVARQGLEYCNRLFKIEGELTNATPDQRLAVRQEKSRPILDDMHNWLKNAGLEVLPKSPSGKAVQYCLNQWEKLTAFMLDGRLELSNNRAERSIKPFVMGRKAWLFSNTPAGAEASATVYSIVETAKANNLDPLRYIEYLLEHLPNINWTVPAELDKIAPWEQSIQQKFSVEPKPSTQPRTTIPPQINH